MPSMPVLALVMPAVSGCIAHELPSVAFVADRRRTIRPRMKRGRNDTVRQRNAAEGKCRGTAVQRREVVEIAASLTAWLRPHGRLLTSVGRKASLPMRWART